MANPGPDDLSGLIDAASKEAAGASRARPRKIAPPPRPGKAVPFIAAALAVLAVFGGYEVWIHYAGPTRSKLAADLGVAIDLARESVEAVRKSTGALPEALPNASLAAVVVYEPSGREYRLSASAGGVDVAIERDGSKSVNGEKAE